MLVSPVVGVATVLCPGKRAVLTCFEGEYHTWVYNGSRLFSLLGSTSMSPQTSDGFTVTVLPSSTNFTTQLAFEADVIMNGTLVVCYVLLSNEEGGGIIRKNFSLHVKGKFLSWNT